MVGLQAVYCSVLEALISVSRRLRHLREGGQVVSILGVGGRLEAEQ